MKHKKRRFETLSFYDHTGIEHHLTNMAKQGWLIEKISNYYWTYRKIEPCDLTFMVTYFPKASDFDPQLSEEQERLRDFCADTGWELACTWFQMQVFYNESEDPIPINTDPVLEVEAVHKACKASLLKGYYVLIAISGIMSFFFLSSLISDTLRILASPTDMFKGIIWLLLLILILVEVLTYFRWYRKAKKQAEHEIFLETPSTAKFQKIAMGLLVIFLLNWILNIVLVDNPVLLWCCALVAVVIILDHILIQVVKNHLKKKNVSANMNKALTILFSFVFVFVMMGTVVYGSLRFFEDQIRENLPYKAMEAPLYMEDLVHQDSDYVAYLTQTDYEESTILSMMKVTERRSFDEKDDQSVAMTYQRYLVKSPFLYDFCEGQLQRLMVLSEYWKGELLETDAAPWNADRVYRLILDDGTETNRYLLCYDHVLVDIQFNWSPTPEQMAIVSEALSK